MNRDTCPVVVTTDNASNFTPDWTIENGAMKTDRQLRKFDSRHKESQIQDQRTPGKNMSITRAVTAKMNLRTTTSEGDMRRNLYVLGLPFDLMKTDFTKIFEPFGTVTHAVILATVDSASRRRGFIVMSTHQEAKVAMTALSRTQIKGHMLDVSWAVVQRSQGFLDGADRTMMLTVSGPSSFPGSDGVHANSALSYGSDDPTHYHWNLTHVPTTKLLVSNLPTLLFTQVSDLRPLFYPFGPIKDMKILESSPGNPLDETVTAVVQYANASIAREAKETLQFQSYAGYPIGVHYMCDTVPLTDARFAHFPSGSLSGYGKSSDIGLNPFATPFTIGSRSSPGAQTHNSHCNIRYNSAIPSGLPSDTPCAPQPFPMHLRPYILDTISRSSSATSSK
ncbi:hypothetical protein PAXRUDRAFT_829019 [Paxillus rubicundulus Ve08.2h10]|uniref:RRM domain-containing protein n=1 Tax=Paxillus rubicundulus Ve08.2h10 TaxID=930991 RepID=A0A0D0E6N9_9AGAM|nr:hypothetical protein PAXRUDRAFT_829019 [Paxillus rubicundulus Ve08.2h10]